MRCNTIAIATALCWLIAAGGEPVAAAEARHFSFAYDQPHTTAYGIAADTFANKLEELGHGTLVIDQSSQQCSASVFSTRLRPYS